MNLKKLYVVKCENCKKILFYSNDDKEKNISIKCDKCKKINKY